MEQIRTSGLYYALFLWCATAVSDFLSPLETVSAQARRHRIPRLVTRNVNDIRGRAFLTDLQPDLLVSAFFNQRLAEPVFTIPHGGSINIHPSLLPEFRGVDPVFFARLRGAENLGVTIHRIDSDLDTGNILLTEEVPMPAGQSLIRTTAQLFARGAELLAEHIDAIGHGVPGTPQGPAGGYDSWPTPAEVRQLRRAGTPLVRLRDLLALATGSLTRD